MQREDRRLAAIVAADIAGYSRLVGRDEERTLRALRGHRTELIDRLIRDHGGRVANTAGDSLLLEFPSAVDAVRCVLDVQRGMATRNHAVPVDRRIEFRVGINLGDVIAEGDDLLGDGVNIAARLQEIAEPGGIAISGTVQEHVVGKLDVAFEDVGAQEFKNIAQPIHVYHVPVDPQAGTGAAGPAGPGRPRSRAVAAIAATAVVLAIVAGGIIWQEPWRPTLDSTLALPDKPSIAVLPFANLSGDPDQEYFADGISEDLTTQLSKISGLFVISRTTAFQYKGRAADIRKLAQDLGVRYVVEGSVRRGGQDLRVNAQLIDAATGGHLWAETFDGPVGDVFALQDRINEKIVTALKVQLTPDERARVAFRGTENVEAYDAFLRGERFRLHSKVRAHEEAIREYERAIELDPNFGAAYAALGHVLWSRARYSAGGAPQREDVVRAQELANTALTLGEDPATRTLLAKFYLIGKGDYARAEAEARKAIAIDPNNTEGLATLAEVLLYIDRSDVAIQFLQKAMRLDPGFPYSYQILLAQAQFEQKRYRDVINLLTTVCEGAFSQLYYRTCRYYGASAHGHLGEIEAGRMVLRLSEQSWGDSAENRRTYLNRVEIVVAIWFPFKNETSKRHLIEGIQKVIYGE